MARCSLALLALLILGPPAQARAEKKAETRAAAVATTTAPFIAAGSGPSYGGSIGGQLGVSMQLPGRPLRLTPFFGLGYYLVDPAGGSGGDNQAAYAGGLGLSLGDQHRALIEVAYGALASAQASLHGTVVASRCLYGVIFTGGYEYIFSWGLYGRAQIGAGRVIDSAPLLDKTWTVAFNVGLGYKLW